MAFRLLWGSGHWGSRTRTGLLLGALLLAGLPLRAQEESSTALPGEDPPSSDPVYYAAPANNNDAAPLPPARPMYAPASQPTVVDHTEEKPKEASRIPHVALTVNPLTMIFIASLNGMFVLPLNFQAGGRVVALDFLGAVYVNNSEYQAFEGYGGLRFLLKRRGLQGAYIVPRFGGVTDLGFAASLEFGWAGFWDGFVLNLGFGVKVVPDGEYPALPFLNLSLGFGG